MPFSYSHHVLTVILYTPKGSDVSRDKRVQNWLERKEAKGRRNLLRKRHGKRAEKATRECYLRCVQ